MRPWIGGTGTVREGLSLKKKVRVGVMIGILLLVVVSGVAAVSGFDFGFGSEEAKIRAFGETVKAVDGDGDGDDDRGDDGDGKIVAYYNGKPVLQASVVLRRKMFALSEKPTEEVGNDVDKSGYTDQDYIDEIIMEMILLEEAEKRGLAAGEQEIQAQVDMSKQAYAENEMAKQTVDTFCKAADMTVEEYFDRLPSLLAPSISRNHLKAEFSKEHQKEHDSMDQTEISKAFEAYAQDLLTQQYEKGTISLVG